MRGYIAPDKPELKIIEFELYSGYYCGICKSIGKRHGQLPRLTLSYDSVFLALLLAGLQDNREIIRMKRCPIHPIRKKPILYENESVDYASDMHLILSFYKLKDDYKDDHNLLAGTAAFLAKKQFDRLAEKYPEKSGIIASRLKELSDIENTKTASLDQAAEPFAKIMETIFCWDGYSTDGLETERDGLKTGAEMILGRIGYHIGKWIYIIDAFDDIEINIKDNSFNPILIHFGFNSEKEETVYEFRTRIRERIEFNLLSYLEELSKAYDLLPIKKNKALLENIIYLGLLKKTEEVLAKGRNKQNGESI